MKTVNVYYGYINQVNIDANLHPDLQIKALINKILEAKDDELNIFCNSPYVLAYITLIEAYTNKKIPAEHNPYFNIPIKNRHFEILGDGTVVEGKYYKTMIDDDNLLYNKTREINDAYSKLQEIKRDLKKEN